LIGPCTTTVLGAVGLRDVSREMISCDGE
jgi:hypothetical protein